MLLCEEVKVELFLRRRQLNTFHDLYLLGDGEESCLVVKMFVPTFVCVGGCVCVGG